VWWEIGSTMSSADGAIHKCPGPYTFFAPGRADAVLDSQDLGMYIAHKLATNGKR